MGWWRVDADILANSRFVISPLAETIAALLSLERGIAETPPERRWLDAHLPAYTAHLAADPITTRLVRAALGRHWLADFLTPPPPLPKEGTGVAVDVADELRQVRRTPPDTARADVAVAAGGTLPPELERSDLPDRAADLLAWVWTRTVAPSWPQRRHVLEADVVARTRQLGTGGWSAALAGMRRELRWLGDGRLQINTSSNPPRDLSGARLLFVPVTTPHGWVAWDIPHRYAVIYPASGALAEADRPLVAEGLARLVGAARARVLLLLAEPKTTSQLVALTGQGLGSVGRHLEVLRQARLVRRRRTGRSVLYFRTATGDALVAAQDED